MSSVHGDDGKNIRSTVVVSLNVTLSLNRLKAWVSPLRPPLAIRGRPGLTHTRLSTCLLFNSEHLPLIVHQAKFKWERPGGPAASFDLDLQPASGVLRGKEASARAREAAG